MEGLSLHIEKRRSASDCELRVNSASRERITVTSNSELTFQDCLPEDLQVTATRVIGKSIFQALKISLDSFPYLSILVLYVSIEIPFFFFSVNFGGTDPLIAVANRKKISPVSDLIYLLSCQSVGNSRTAQRLQSVCRCLCCLPASPPL